MENTPLAPVDKAQEATKFNKPSLADNILLPPADQLRQAIEAALVAFEPGFVLSRNQPETPASVQHDST